MQKNSKFKNNTKNLNNALIKERRFGIENPKTYKKFFKKIENIKYNLKKLVISIKNKNQNIHGYGASTKGNVLLQYFGIGKEFIDYIADRNQENLIIILQELKLK